MKAAPTLTATEIAIRDAAHRALYETGEANELIEVLTADSRPLSRQARWFLASAAAGGRLLGVSEKDKNRFWQRLIEMAELGNSAALIVALTTTSEKDMWRMTVDDRTSLAKYIASLYVKPLPVPPLPVAVRNKKIRAAVSRRPASTSKMAHYAAVGERFGIGPEMVRKICATAD